MPRFILRLALFLSIQAAIGVALWLRGHDPEGYFSATNDKHRRAAALSSPKLLLIGDSSMAFGVDSPVLEQALGRRTVNMGLHADIGLEFILNEAHDIVRSGDVVVVSLAYEHFYAEEKSIEAVHYPLLRARPASARYLSRLDFRLALDRGLVVLHSMTRKGVRGQRDKKKTDEIYSRAAFNEHGDFVAHHNRPSLYRAGPLPAPRAPDVVELERIDRTIARLNEFGRDCRRQDVGVLFLLPPIAKDVFAANQHIIEAIDATLRSRLIVPVIGDLPSTVLDSALFYDTCYHLTWQGKQIRTARFVGGLAGQMGANEVAARAAVAEAYRPWKVRQTAVRTASFRQDPGAAAVVNSGRQQ